MWIDLLYGDGYVAEFETLEEMHAYIALLNISSYRYEICDPENGTYTRYNDKNEVIRSGEL